MGHYNQLAGIFWAKLFRFIVILDFKGIHDNKYMLLFQITKLSLLGGQITKDSDLEQLVAPF